VLKTPFSPGERKALTECDLLLGTKHPSSGGPVLMCSECPLQKDWSAEQAARVTQSDFI